MRKITANKVATGKMSCEEGTVRGIIPGDGLLAPQKRLRFPSRFK